RKDKRQRMPDVGAVRIVIDDVLTGAASANAIPTARGRQRSGWIPTALAAVLLLLLAALSYVHFREAPPLEERAGQFEVPSPTPQVGAFAISPDGRYLAM